MMMPSLAAWFDLTLHRMIAIRAKKIYVEIDIRGPLERVWQLSQTPASHERWDLRFTEISYIPRASDSEPQRFVYATRIGFGMNIRGEGESIGTHDGPNGSRSSALRFSSKDPKSLICDGSGYWKYVPLAGSDPATRFLTLYDYDVRFGLAGVIFDRMIFRPLIGWATAWSFDRLRLWIERGLDPAAALRNSLLYFTARMTVAFVWIYQGLIPKLLFHSADELTMIRVAGVHDAHTAATCAALGLIEIAIGLSLIIAWRATALLWFTLLGMVIASVTVAARAPEFLTAAFNPISLNLCVFALSLIALLINRDLPSAEQCVRKQPRGGE
jgi:hypothetical protein